MKKRSKILASLVLAGTMVLGLAGCGDSGSANGGTQSGKNSDAKYQVGICQLVQHEALDAATKGFKDALKDKLGDEVSFDEQNAAGDASTCSTICTKFVTNDYDLILGNATAALQAASAATDSIPILGTSITDYATALDMSDWSGTTGKNISGTTDLAPLDEQAKCIKELFPDAKNIGIIYCSSEPNSIYQSTTITKYLEDEGYTVKEYTFSDSNDVAAVTQSACDASDAIYIPTDNTAASCTEAINNVASQAKKPIFAGEEGIAVEPATVYIIGVEPPRHAVGQACGIHCGKQRGLDYAALHMYARFQRQGALAGLEFSVDHLDRQAGVGARRADGGGLQAAFGGGGDDERGARPESAG